MDDNIIQSVYNSLYEGTEGVSKDIADYNAVTADIDSGRFSEVAIREELFPKKTELKTKIEHDSAAVIKNAQALIDQYRADAAELNNLNPADITDDIKLLQSGVTLLPRDIQAILKRNEGNRTMTQMALRYAQEHNIETGQYYVGVQQEEQTARKLEEILKYYEKYIGQPDADKVLNRFFGI